MHKTPILLDLVFGGVEMIRISYHGNLKWMTGDIGRCLIVLAPLENEAAELEGFLC